ncbi:MAG TPA: PGPGW domain-containing protein [Nitrospinota bacterium]|nr:PGPGW domain-containing protein [Nitrospinota bacterium]
MKKKVKHILILSAGWFFIFFGIIGLFLPILQGILFLFVGFYLLSHESKTAEKLSKKLKERYPSLAKNMDRAKEKTRNIKVRLFKRDIRL